MNDPKCLNPHCEKQQFQRGLCRSCYQSARRYVKLGKTSWENLVNQGKALVPLKPGFQPTEKTKWFLQP